MRCRSWKLLHSRQILFQDAILDVLTQLTSNRVHDGAEVLALVERVERITHEQTVESVHYAESTNNQLVVQHDLCQSLQVAETWLLLEGEHLHLRNCQTVKRRRLGGDGFLGFVLKKFVETLEFVLNLDDLLGNELLVSHCPSS